MPEITDADRKAAQELRIVLADVSGYWHRGGDDSPLCIALAQHRIAAEQSLMEKIVPLRSNLGNPSAGERAAGERSRHAAW